MFDRFPGRERPSIRRWAVVVIPVLVLHALLIMTVIMLRPGPEYDPFGDTSGLGIGGAAPPPRVPKACGAAGIALIGGKEDWVSAPADGAPVQKKGTFGVLDLAVSPRDGSLYVVTSGSPSVLHLAANGTSLHRWGDGSDGSPSLDGATAITVDSRNVVHVADDRGRVHAYTADGKHLGTYATGFSSIDGIAALRSGHLVISRNVAKVRDSGRPYVALVDTAGRMVRTVLRPNARPIGARPLQHDGTAVRVTASPPGGFVVWYPQDSYVDVFTETGDYQRTHRGCMDVPDAASPPVQHVVTLGATIARNGVVTTAKFRVLRDSMAVTLTGFNHGGLLYEADFMVGEMFGGAHFLGTDQLLLYSSRPGAGIRLITADFTDVLAKDSRKPGLARFLRR